MTLPRSQLINTRATPYYHCVSRCVRRAFLCGRDAQTGYNFEHRRAWIEYRLQHLAGIFAIDLCAYAVMSNHYHVVLHINKSRLESWGDHKIVSRYKRLHRLPPGFDETDTARKSKLISTWRDRLGSISWFMKCVNEPLARMANKEDGCKGRFWEGRFRSQALLDELAVLKCMAYVDLNPVRALRAKTPEESDHTSIKARIRGCDQALAPMAESEHRDFRLPVRFPDYLQLVECTGRELRVGKRGRVHPGLPKILDRLRVPTTRSWLDDMAHLTRRYCRAIGSEMSLRRYRDFLGQTRLNGISG